MSLLFITQQLVEDKNIKKTFPKLWIKPINNGKCYFTENCTISTYQLILTLCLWQSLVVHMGVLKNFEKNQMIYAKHAKPCKETNDRRY